MKLAVAVIFALVAVSTSIDYRRKYHWRSSAIVMVMCVCNIILYAFLPYIIPVEYPYDLHLYALFVSEEINLVICAVVMMVYSLILQLHIFLLDSKKDWTVRVSYFITIIVGRQLFYLNMKSTSCWWAS